MAANPTVVLTVEDNSFNAHIKRAAKAFGDFSSRVASAGTEAFVSFAKGANTAKTAMNGFNKALKANAIVLVTSLAIEAAGAVADMIGGWIEGADDAAEAQKRLNSELEATAQAIKEIKAEGDFNARMAKAAGASTSEVLQMKYTAASDAYNKALSQLMNPEIKAGTDEYEKAQKMLEDAEKMRRKAWEDIQVDRTAQEHHTGEYAEKTTGSNKTNKEITYASDSIKAQEVLVQTLTQKWNEAGAGVRDMYVKELVDAKAKLKEMQDEQNLLMEQSQGKFLKEDVHTEDVPSTILGSQIQIGDGLKELPQHLSPLQQMNNELARMKELLELAPDTTAYKEALQSIVDKEKEIAEFKDETDTEKVAKGSAESWKNTASAISSVGSAFANIEDPAAKIMGTIGQAIATVAMAYAQSLSKDKGTQSNIWAFIAAAAAATISMVTTIASIHSATGYSHGGIVDGNSFSGDNVPIMANAGEVVLTKAMQSNLANQLDGAGLQGLGPSSVSGEQIYVVLNRYTRRSGKGELVTW